MDGWIGKQYNKDAFDPRAGQDKGIALVLSDGRLAARALSLRCLFPL